MMYIHHMYHIVNDYTTTRDRIANLQVGCIPLNSATIWYIAAQNNIPHPLNYQNHSQRGCDGIANPFKLRKHETGPRPKTRLRQICTPSSSYKS